MVESFKDRKPNVCVCLFPHFDHFDDALFCCGGSVIVSAVIPPPPTPGRCLGEKWAAFPCWPVDVESING